MRNKPIDNTFCHCLKMRRTAGNVLAFYDRILAPSGVTTNQYFLLFSIAQGEPCSAALLAERTELDRSTLARSLKPLLTQKLVVDKKPKGARDRQLFLTDEGRAVLSQAMDLWSQAQAAFEQILTPQQLDALEDVLTALQFLE